MNEVVDAKIVKIIQVNSCSDCPYTGCHFYIGTDDEYYYCAKYLQEGLGQSTEDCIISNEVSDGWFWSKCPLPSATCVTTEEVHK